MQELDFSDRKTREKLERMMTPSAKRALHEVLGHVMMTSTREAASLIQKTVKADRRDDGDGSEDDDNSGAGEDMPLEALSSLGVSAQKSETVMDQGEQDEPPKTTTTIPGLPTPPVPKTKVVKRLLDDTVSQDSARCPNTPPDCCLLHDNMSLMWGKFKDLVDELQAEMDKNEFEFTSLTDNLNQQLDVLRSTKATFIIKLNEAAASMNADWEDASEKESELLKLMKEYKGYMKRCTAKIRWTFLQDFCGYFVVRAQIMGFSKVCPPRQDR